MRVVLILSIVAIMLSAGHRVEAGVAFSRDQDVIYGHDYGMALTMDVFTPERDANGAAVVFPASLGWGSNRRALEMMPVTELLSRGYTVFVVMHGSKPKFTITEVIEHLHRAVRHIRYHAERYKIDPDRIGATGVSSGCHLALILGTAGHKGKSHPRDPVGRVHSGVQAVACYFPPTDFLNYEAPGQDAIGRGALEYYRSCFDFHEFDKKENRFQRVTDENKIKAIGRDISPITHVSADDAPTLLIHGEADMVVPIRQAETFLDKLEAAGVSAKLVAKPEATHLYDGWENDMSILADWFDKHLGTPSKTK